MSQIGMCEQRSLVVVALVKKITPLFSTRISIESCSALCQYEPRPYLAFKMRIIAELINRLDKRA